MITHQEFIKKYLGTFYREKGIDESQCVALGKLFSKEVHGIEL
jgi:uncharacterized protein (DUF2164 family)